MANTKSRLAVPITPTSYVVFSGTKKIYDTLKTILGLKDDSAGLGNKIEGVAVSNFNAVGRLRVRYRASGTDVDPVFKYGTVICAGTHLDDALKGLPGKSYKEGKISEAYQARRRLLY